MRETIAELKRRIDGQGMEMLALEIELDRVNAELLKALRELAQYHRWHIQSISQESEAEE